MHKITFAERLYAAIFGALFGTIISLIVAWLLGVYSTTLGSGHAGVNFRSFALSGAALFGLLGFIMGEHIGTFIGQVFNFLFEFEKFDPFPSIQPWHILLILISLLSLGKFFLS